MLHGVVDRHAGRHYAAGRVDVEVDVLVGVVGFEEQQLGDDDIGDIVVDRRAEEHDPVHQQPGEDVVGALAPAGTLDDVRRIQGGHGQDLTSSMVDCLRRKSYTFSSVITRSSSCRRLAFCNEAYTWATGAPRAAAMALIRWSSSASVALSP